MGGLTRSSWLNRLFTGGIAAPLMILLLVCACVPVSAEASETIVVQPIETGEENPEGNLILQIEEWEDLQIKDDKSGTVSSGTEKTETETETEEETETEKETEIEETETEEETEDGTEEEKERGPVLPEEEAVYNLLLIGTDRRDENWNGNSDVMILATINMAAEKICLTSFMRDLYADIPENGVHKLNYAYAKGGPEMLVSTLESNYEIDIDNYAIVDFETMSELIDIVGGVEITVSDEEVPILNDYLTCMETDAEKDHLKAGGTYKLNGMQAVAYMRIRFVGNNDYQRTQRQRDVLQALLGEMKDLDTGELLKIAGTSLLLVKHDIGMFQLLKLAGELPQYLGYDIEESRVPYDGLFTSQNEMLVPDFEETIRKLHETIYENTDAEPESDTEFR